MPDPPPIPDESRDVILSELERIAEALTRMADDSRVLYERRLELYRAGTEAGITQRDMAAAAKVTPVAIAVAMNKERRRAETG